MANWKITYQTTKTASTYLILRSGLELTPNMETVDATGTTGANNSTEFGDREEGDLEGPIIPDEKGPEESSSQTSVILLVSLTLVGVLVILLAIFWSCKCKNSADYNHIKGLPVYRLGRRSCEISHPPDTIYELLKDDTIWQTNV